MRIPSFPRIRRSKSGRRSQKRSRQQQARSSFLSTLRVESLEDRRMLHGGADVPHDHAPTHALSDDIHADLRIVVEGQQVTIPQDVGVSGSGNIAFVHTEATDNRLHMEQIDTNGDQVLESPADFVTMGDFFETWRTNAGTAGNNDSAVFSGTEILGNVADNQHAMRMFVNGIQTDDYENYVIHDEDDIVISYSSSPVVALNTNHGTILMEMLPGNAPNTVANFLDYVNDGDYDNSFIHRSISGFVVQGGGFVTSNEVFTSTSQFTSVSTNPPIVNEFDISNTVGTVAMAKLGGDPNSATSQWFVNMADNRTNLDGQNGGFTVFARVLDMQPVDTIAAVPAENAGGSFTDLPVNIDGKLVVVESVAGDGTVSGVAFNDADGDGVHDAGEAALPGTVIYVDADTNGSFDLGELSTTTAGDGSYHFRLAAGAYTIRQQVPGGQTQTTVDQSTSVLIGSDTINLDLGSGTLPSAPTAVDLVAIADTGFSDTDNTTSRNNTSVVQSLEFVVSGVQDGAVVSLLADGQQIGQAVAVGNEATVITAGSQVLADGSHAITATQSLGVLESTASSSLSVLIDTAVEDFSSTPPTTATIAEALVYDVQNPEETDPGFAYSIDSMPEGMAINATTGIVTW
ncbi:MAG: peptidylprolyl isomerase, partial [Pirellulaceae bacterium]